MSAFVTLTTDFEEMRREFLINMTDNMRTPVSIAIEFLEAFSQELFGPVSPDQKKLSEAALQELTHLNSVITNMLSGRRLLGHATGGVIEITPKQILEELRNRFDANGKSRKVKVHLVIV